MKAEQLSFEKLEPGIEKHTRYSDECEYVFYLNDSDKEVIINVEDGYNLVTNETVAKSIKLQTKEFAIIRRTIR